MLGSNVPTIGGFYTGFKWGRKNSRKRNKNQKQFGIFAGNFKTEKLLNKLKN